MPPCRQCSPPCLLSCRFGWRDGSLYGHHRGDPGGSIRTAAPGGGRHLFLCE